MYGLEVSWARLVGLVRPTVATSGLPTSDHKPQQQRRQQPAATNNRWQTGCSSGGGETTLATLLASLSSCASSSIAVSYKILAIKLRAIWLHLWPPIVTLNLVISLHLIVYLFICCYYLSKFLSNTNYNHYHQPAGGHHFRSFKQQALQRDQQQQQQQDQSQSQRAEHQLAAHSKPTGESSPALAPAATVATTTTTAATVTEPVWTGQPAEVGQQGQSNMTYLPVDVIVDQKGKERHKIDTLNLLAYVVLLVIVLLTTWYFKRRRRLLIHETGLAIIYGMVLGAALRYIGLEIIISSVMLDDQTPQTVPHDYVIVRARNLGDKNANQSHYYAYEFRGELQPAAKLGSQISYASVDPEVFFNIILPPIVLNAGLSLKRRHFFRNIGAIFSYAFIGTTISVAFVGSFIYGSIQLIKLTLGYTYLADQFSLASCLYFGAIISPTDPLAVLSIFTELGVDVNLFALVFGESILNDAVSIVLTHSIDQFSIISARDPYHSLLAGVLECILNFAQMFFTSCILGVLFGVISALTTKFTKLSETPLLETSLVVLMSYCSFLTAEVIDASGIVAILLCGITQAHYTINNLSFEARERLKNLFELLTFVCENFLFLAVGVALWQRDQTWNLPFIGLAFVACIIARAISIYPLTGLLNLGRRNKISSKFQHVIAWGGAARGVISYSLAARNTVGDARRIMLSTTSAIVVFSVIMVGSSVDILLRILDIPVGNHQEHEQLTDENGGPQTTTSAAGAPSDTKRLIGCENAAWTMKQHNTNKQRGHYGSYVASSALTPYSGGQQSGTPASLVSVGSKYTQRRLAAADLEPTPVIEVDAATLRTRPLRHRNHSADDLMGSQQQHLQYSQSASIVIQHQQQHQIVDARLPVLSERRDSQATDMSPTPVRPTAAEAANMANPEDRHSLSMDMAASGSDYSDSARCSHLALNQAAADPAAAPYENATLVRRWRNLDNNFIKPLLTNSQPTLMETMPPSLRKLARWFTSDEQMLRSTSVRN